MLCLIIGTEPSKTAVSHLEEAGFTCETQANLPQKGRKVLPELVIYSPRALPTKTELEKLKTLFPNSWTILSAKKSWLDKEDLASLLENSRFPNDVWLREEFDANVKIGLRHLATEMYWRSETEKLRTTLKETKSECEILSDQTNKLADQFERDVDLATNIQRSLLPKRTPQIPGVNIRAKFVPAAGVGGDYYDIFEFGDKTRYGLILADSQTHGMAAAFLSVLIKLRLEEMKEKFPDSSSFVEYLNNEIQRVHKNDLAKLSLIYGIFDRSTLSFQYTIAGKLRPILWRHGEATILSNPVNPPLGGVDQFKFKEGVITLKPADLLVFSTDGLAPALKAEESSGNEKLVEMLKSKDPLPDTLDFQNEVMSKIDAYKAESPLPDDITIIQLSIEQNTLYVASKESN